MSCHILSDAEGSRLPEPAALRAMETGTAPAKETQRAALVSTTYRNKPGCNVLNYVLYTLSIVCRSPHLPHCNSRSYQPRRRH